MLRRTFARFHQSAFLTDIYTLPQLKAGDTVTLRARVQNSRVKGKLGFLHLRQPGNCSVQVVVSDNNDLIHTAKQLTKESVVEVSGKIQHPSKPIASTSCSNIELAATELRVVSKAQSPLPYPLRDRNTKLDTRLDHRAYDLRTTQNGAIFRLQSHVVQLYRRFMTQRDFVEIHSPKIIGTPSEGGSAIFKLEYFTRPAYLAQSPQLYKQMAVLGDLTRVIEIGPVFRAENSQTHRHLTEYVGLDAEMAIRSTYLEVLDELEQAVVYIITNLQAEYEGLLHAAATPDLETATGNENATTAVAGGEGTVDGLQLLGAPGGFKPIHATVDSATIEDLGLGDDTNGIASSDKYGGRVSDADCPVLRMKFDHAIELLRDNSILSAAEASTVNDLNSAQEKKLGELIKARYGVDLYIVDQYHLSARPFYTMPLGDKHSRSFDMFLRGEEICSGAQRVHDAELLTERAKACGVSTDLISDYLNAFRYGAWPHGGFGLGLERLVMFLVGLPNVRQTSLFPRDPKRLTP